MMNQKRQRRGKQPPRFGNGGIDLRLVYAAQKYHDATVGSHCLACRHPCCKLTTMALELDWPQVRNIFRVETKRNDFDRALRCGRGPSHIKEKDGRYYVFGRPCPAYDTHTKRCRVYDLPAKPQACSEFPIYVDGNAITVDSRCEAVNVETLILSLQRAAPDLVIFAETNRQRPELTSIAARRRRRPHRR